MKTGDKVILRKFANTLQTPFLSKNYKYVGKEAVVVDFNGETCIVKIDNEFYGSWNISSCEIIKESQECFYVGQTVYSPLFHNKNGSAVVISINKSSQYPVLCQGENVLIGFTFDGICILHEDIMLFQEPIQFPVNKPIKCPRSNTARFEKAKELLEYFVKRVEEGSIKSKTTYKLYKDFLNSLKDE